MRNRIVILRFLVVGTTTVLIDWLFYRLTMFAGVSIGLAKGIGFIAGAGFAFCANRSWTFSVAGRWTAGELARFVMAYSSTLVINVGVNGGVLVVIGHDQRPLAVAFVIATAVSAVLNFVAMKFLVFRPACP